MSDRYFVEHDVVHDRETSRHVIADECAERLNLAIAIAESQKREVERLRAELAELAEACQAGAWKPSEVWREEVADETAERIATWLSTTQGTQMQLAPANVIDAIRSGKWKEQG